MTKAIETKAIKIKTIERIVNAPRVMHTRLSSDMQSLDRRASWLRFVALKSAAQAGASSLDQRRS
jgi:hypothetical protein